MKRKDETNLVYRSHKFDREHINEETREVACAFSTETDQVQRFFGTEILDHGAASIRLGRLNNDAPLLLGHDLDRQIGVVVNAEKLSFIDTQRVRDPRDR